MPDSMYAVVEKAAIVDGYQDIRGFISDAVMIRVCGKTKMQFLEEAKKGIK
jgi:hypothetical protein